MADESWTPESPDDAAWGEMFSDEIDRERWRTNFGKDSEGAEAAAYWRDLVPGIEPSVAAIYKKEGMTPYEIQDFQQVGIGDFKEVLGWRRVKAQPEVAQAFKEKGVNPETYEKWNKIGVQDPDTMLRFAEDFKLEAGQLEKFIKPLIDEKLVDLPSVSKWLETGIDIREVGDWIRQGFKYPSIAAKWKSLRFKPNDAAEWGKVLQRPENAAVWLSGGYKNIKDIEGLIKMGYESPDEIERESENLIIKTR